MEIRQHNRSFCSFKVENVSVSAFYLTGIVGYSLAEYSDLAAEKVSVSYTGDGNYADNTVELAALENGTLTFTITDDDNTYENYSFLLGKADGMYKLADGKTASIDTVDLDSGSHLIVAVAVKDNIAYTRSFVITIKR